MSLRFDPTASGWLINMGSSVKFPFFGSSEIDFSFFCVPCSSVTTMEEVFLKVSAGEAAGLDEKRRRATLAARASNSIAIPKVKKGTCIFL